MRKLLVVAIASAALLALAAPSAMAGDRHGGGRGHSGGHSGKHWGAHSHGHGHWRGGYWGPGIAIGVSPFYWPYAYHSPSVVYAEPPAVYTEPSAAYAPSADTAAPPAVEREVVYPHGRYVLYGDGVSTPYRWVWIPGERQ